MKLRDLCPILDDAFEIFGEIHDPHRGFTDFAFLEGIVCGLGDGPDAA
jgi:hypothetical protein